MIDSYDNLEQAIRQLRHDSTADLDQRILQDALSALEESAGSRAIAKKAKRWIVFARLASAAVFIAAAMIGVTFYLRSIEKQPQDVVQKAIQDQQDFTGFDKTDQKPDKTRIDDEIARIISFVVSEDVAGLVELLDSKDFIQKPMVAMCLGQIGDERALAPLHSLDLAALESGLYTEENSPYAQAIAAIEARLGEAEDANDIAVVISGQGLRIASEKGFLILGVIDGSTEKPVENAVLDIQMQRDGPDEALTAFTDANGIYKIGLPSPIPRYVNVTALKDGFVPVVMSFGDFNGRKPLPETYIVSLDHGTSIGGVVKNEMAEPVEGATVYLYVPGSKQRNEVEKISIRDYGVKTDTLGRWKCNSMPQEIAEVQVRLSHPDYVDDEYYNASERPTVESLRDQTCEFILKRGVALSGKVLDLQGLPIKGAHVLQGANRSNTNYSYPQTTTADDGSFNFKQCRKGEIVLTVQAEGFGPDLKKVLVSPETFPVEFRLGPSYTIRGRVFDIDNNPIPAVTVLLDSWRGCRSLNWRAETDAEGYFEWTGAPPDEVIVNLFKGGYMTIYNMPMSPLADEYRLTMYPPLKVKGMVFDAQTGEPVTDFRIVTGIRWAHNPNIYWNTDQKDVKAFDDGSYECEFIYPSESHFIRIEAEGYLSQISRDFGNEEGAVIYDFMLEKGAGLDGTVFLPDGTPAAGAEVIISTETHPATIQNGYISQKRKPPSVKSNERGEFSLPGQTEDYMLVVLHDSGCAEVTKDIFSGNHNIVLKPWGRVEGVVYEAGEAGANEQVTLHYEKQDSEKAAAVNYIYKSIADSNGFFVMDRLIPDQARIGREIQISRNRSLTTSSKMIDILPGENLSVQIGGKGISLIGRVVPPADIAEQIDWAMTEGTLDRIMPYLPYPENYSEMSLNEKTEWLELWKKTPQGQAYLHDRDALLRNTYNYAMKINADGTFRIDDVTAGDYKLNISLYEQRGTAAYRDPGEIIAEAIKDVNIPHAEQTGRAESLDLGVIELKLLERLDPGETAQDFEINTLDGKTIKLSDYRGSVAVLNFWNLRDGRIMSVIAQMKALYNKYASDHFVIISVMFDDPETAAKFVSENEIEWSICVADSETKEKFYKDYHLQKLPMTFVIDPDGRVVIRNPDSLELELMLSNTLNR